MSTMIISEMNFSNNKKYHFKMKLKQCAANNRHLLWRCRDLCLVYEFGDYCMKHETDEMLNECMGSYLS